jgi:hypothetical protein
MDVTDLARFTEDVLATLMGATDRDGLKIVLGPDAQITILAAAITAVNNRRTDTRLFEAISLGDLVKEA